MSKWKVEGSYDKETWTEIVSMPSASLAYAALEVAIDRADYHWVRILSPTGNVEETLRTDE